VDGLSAQSSRQPAWRRRSALSAAGALGVAVLVAVTPRFPLPASVIYSSLCAVAAVLTWVRSTLDGGPRRAGVPNIRTPADKLPDNGRSDGFTESGADEKRSRYEA
jgi:hypothetical protein